MKRARLGSLTISAPSRLVLALAISLLAVGGLALGLGGSAGAATAQSSPAPVRTVVLDCPGLPALVRPKAYIITCADGYDQVNKLSWTSWTPGLASATGTLVVNNCAPTCVAGHFDTYPVLVVFWGKAAVKNHPREQCYTRMTIIYPGHRPRGAPLTQTITLPTSLAT